MITRRDLLKLSALVAAATITITPPLASRFKDWMIQWRGWRQIDTQDGQFGFWVAYRRSDLDDLMNHRTPKSPILAWYATTLGVVASAREMERLDTTRIDKTWPFSLRHSEREFEHAKQRAKAALEDKLMTL